MMLPRILEFIEFTHKFRQIKRKVLVNGEDRHENDMEHSYQLAMLAWYINETSDLNLDSNLLIRYALVHDLVETYAGDVPVSIYKNSNPDRSRKKEKEAKALQRISKEFSDFKDMMELMKKYELREDPESKFVHSLDKLLPALNIYSDNGRSWKVHKAEFDKLIGWKDKTILDKNIKPLWEELREKILKNKDGLFTH